MSLTTRTSVQGPVVTRRSPVLLPTSIRERSMETVPVVRRTVGTIHGIVDRDLRNNPYPGPYPSPSPSLPLLFYYPYNSQDPSKIFVNRKRRSYTRGTRPMNLRDESTSVLSIIFHLLREKTLLSSLQPYNESKSLQEYTVPHLNCCVSKISMS